MPGLAFDSMAMNAELFPDQQPDQAAQAARRQLEETLQQDSKLQGGQIDKLLRFLPGKRALFSGTLNETPAVFRQYYEDSGMQQAKNQWAELNRVCAYLDKSPYRINAPLHMNEEHRVLVVERVQGRPLLNHMRKLDADERLFLIGEAVRWLHAYTKPSEDNSPTRVNNWLARAADASVGQPHKKLRDLETRVLTKMEELAEQITGRVWRKAICHGDFHPNNLLVSNDALIGIDIGGSDRIPIYKDMARFMVHMARRNVLPSGRRRHGVDGATFEEFAVVFGLNGTEIELFLPFMIGFEILFRVEQKQLDARRVGYAEQLTTSWLEDVD